MSRVCVGCSRTGSSYEIKKYGNYYLCAKCKAHHTKPCAGCGKARVPYLSEHDEHYCKACYDELFTQECACGRKVPQREPHVYTDAHGVTHTDDKVKCDRCISKTYWCDLCEELHVRSGMGSGPRILPNGGSACRDSFNRMYFTCSVCDNAHLRTEESDHSGVCKACAPSVFQCPSCLRMRTASVEVDGEVICERCASRVNTCEACDKKSRTVIYTFNGSGYLCADCRHTTGSAGEHDWKYRPSVFNMYGNSDDITLGIENEISISTDKRIETVFDAVAAQYHDSLAYMVHDGTINYGTELVTHPMTLNYFKAMDVSGLVPKGTRASKTTGMHVHISRKAFTDYSLYLFMRFISTNPNFIEYIAGRKGGGSHQWRFTNEGLLAEKACGIDPGDKYVDVNIKHKETVELRIFKGAITEKVLRKNVEFSHALAVWCKSKFDNFSVEEFCKWVDKDVYPNLKAHLDKKPVLSEDPAEVSLMSEKAFDLLQAKLKQQREPQQETYGVSLREWSTVVNTARIPTAPTPAPSYVGRRVRLIESRDDLNYSGGEYLDANHEGTLVSVWGSSCTIMFPPTDTARGMERFSVLHSEIEFI